MYGALQPANELPIRRVEQCERPQDVTAPPSPHGTHLADGVDGRAEPAEWACLAHLLAVAAPGTVDDTGTKASSSRAPAGAGAARPARGVAARVLTEAATSPRLLNCDREIWRRVGSAAVP
ncbi:hypothetical protein CP982_03155 [Streptomyces spectabilis]|uniref:Uncharacterized protein n=1 Tax=Streptomyces spectabilis TaxID=68270 RepID=A0A5P2X5I6_STRST|nr:hypothetical protein CP982_03155 [Streptomyces spectabilis]